MSTEDREIYQNFIRNLKTQESRPNALNEIKNLLLYKPPSEALATIGTSRITHIIRCLDVDNESHVHLTCEILKLFFDLFAPCEAIKSYTSHFMHLLRHEKDCVRRLAVDEVYKTLQGGKTLLAISDYIDVYVAVAQMLGDRDLEIAQKAVLITSNLPFAAYQKIFEEIKNLEDNISTKCNVYEVIINISCKSPKLLKLCAHHGYIEHMLLDLKSRDLLFQLNILEILSKLATTDHGVDYIIKSDAIEIVGQLLLNPRSDNLLKTGSMKFIGCLVHHYPGMISENREILIDCVFDAIETNDSAILHVALDTFGFIGKTIEGKFRLVATGSKFTEALEKVGELTKYSPAEIKVRALLCLANLIEVQDLHKPTTIPVDHRITLMTREWFRSISTNPTSMEHLYAICKNPFTDIKLAAFSLLDAVCQHQWGIEMVARTAGFVEYLLDRSYCHEKQVIEVKYEIIKRLSNSSVFDENIKSRICKYVHQGPFYSGAVLQVAMEEVN